MKKLLGILCTLLIIFAISACGETKTPEPESEPSEVVQSEPEPEPEHEPEPDRPDIVQAELKEASEESKSPESTASAQTNQAPIVSYVAYDHMGLSHQAVITDPVLLERVMSCFNSPGDGTDDISLGMGGAAGIIIEKDGAAKEYRTAFTFVDGEDVMFETVSGGKEYYFIKDKTLFNDLYNAYHNDNYMAELPYSFDMSLVYFYKDYIDDTMTIQGEEGRLELEAGTDMERFKTVIASSTPYKGTIKDPEKVGGEGIAIETIEVREFKIYHLYKLPDGTVLCRLSGGLSDNAEEIFDNTLYVVSDSGVYDYVISAYFSGLKPKYNVKGGVK